MSVFNAPVVYLDASIESVLNQSFEDFEFVIIDDGSSEAIHERLKEHAERDCRIRLYRLKSNAGLTKALNEGLRLVKGQYIARQDADDLSGPLRLAESYSHLESHPEIAAVGTNASLIDRSGNAIGRIKVKPGLDGIFQKNILVHGSMMFRTDMLREIGGYDERMVLSQDYELYLRMLRLYGMQIGVLEKDLYFLRQHSGSLSSRRMIEQFYYSVLAKSLTSSIGTREPRSRVLFVLQFAMDLVFGQRMFLGPLFRKFIRHQNRAD